MEEGGPTVVKRRTRNLTRLVLVLLGGFLAGERLIDASEDWRLWHNLAVEDPSAADLYRTNFWFDVAVAAVAVGGACLAYRLLRPPEDTP
jgi:hypothetical protein